MSETAAGHNSNPELNSFVKRIERVQDEISVAREDLKEVYAEAKARGYDTKILRKLVAMRKRKPEAVKEEMALLETYGLAVGMGDIFS